MPFKMAFFIHSSSFEKRAMFSFSIFYYELGFGQDYTRIHYVHSDSLGLSDFFSGNSDNFSKNTCKVPKLHAKCRAKFENFQKLASKNSCFIILTHIHSRCQSFLHIYCKSNVQIIKSNFTIETQRNFRKTAPKIKMFKIFKRNQHSHICFKIRLLFFDI